MLLELTPIRTTKESNFSAHFFFQFKVLFGIFTVISLGGHKIQFPTKVGPITTMVKTT